MFVNVGNLHQAEPDDESSGDGCCVAQGPMKKKVQTSRPHPEHCRRVSACGFLFVRLHLRMVFGQIICLGIAR